MLTGRDEELRALRELLGGAREGRGAALRLTGDPGIGKSALLDQLAAQAQAGGDPADPAGPGVRVLRTTGYETEVGLSYAGLHLLLHPVLDRVSLLPAPQRDALRAAFGLGVSEPDAAADRLLVGLAVLTLLSDLSEAKGTVLCLVDDAHWVDRPTLEALVFAGRRLGTEKVALLLAERQGSETLERSGLRCLEVAGLSSDDAANLLERRADAPGAAARARILAQAAGNPLALLELPASAGEEHGVGLLSNTSVPELPERLRQAFLAQVAQLPPAGRDLVRLAATADGPELDVLLRAAPLFGVPAEAMDAAERAGLLTVDQGTFTFRHPLLRTAIVSATPVPQRLAAHRALAGALTGPEDTGRRIWHESAAATEPDERLAAELERTAGRAARRGGGEAVVATYDRAARLSPAPAERLRRWLLAAEAAVDQGDAIRAEECAALAESVLLETGAGRGSAREDEGDGEDKGGHDGAPVADAGLRARLLLAKASARFELGDLRAAYQTCYTGAGELVRTGGQREAAWLLCQSVDVAWFLGDREVEAYSDLFMSLDQVGPDEPAYAVGLYVESAILLSLRQGLGYRPFQLPEVVAKARAAGYQGTAAMITLGTLAPILGQDEEALELFAELLAESREHGRMAWVSPALGALARAQAHRGRLAEARAAAEEAYALAEAAGQTQWLSQVSGLRAYLAAAAGEEEACRAYAREALTDLAPTVMSLGESWGRWALGLLDLGLGRPASALEHLRLLENGAAVHQLAATRALPDLLEAAVRTGDRELAEAALERLAGWAGGIGQDAADALVLRGEALLAEDEASAARSFTAALKLYERADRPFDRARTQLLWGERLRRDRRKSEARAPLNAALETFERLGAAPWAERARQELAASGGGAAPAAATYVTRENGPAAAALAALTSQEAQIVRLAAQGMSNRDIAAQLILSPRTVGHHLYKAYPKLGVLSRGELPALLGSR